MGKTIYVGTNALAAMAERMHRNGEITLSEWYEIQRRADKTVPEWKNNRIVEDG